MSMLRSLVAVGALATATALPAQILIVPPYAGPYIYTDLGSVPGLPSPYGGVTFAANDANTLLIGGDANSSLGAIYAVHVVRDVHGFVTGFSGTAALVANAPDLDGGLCYAPGNVLLYTTYGPNQLGQIKPGSTVADRMIDLTPLGVSPSTGTCTIVPAGFPGQGQLKVASYNNGTVHGFAIAPDGNGTYDLTPVNGPVQILGGPEGLLYVPDGSPLLQNREYMLVDEYVNGEVVLYHLDVDGNPEPATRTVFLTGLSGAEGSCIDPITGDLFFVTYGGGDHVLRVTGFGVCGSFNNYGFGVPGLNGIPTIRGTGCAGRGQITGIAVQSGRANAPGLLGVGVRPLWYPVMNGVLLVDVINTYFHNLDATGQWNLSIQLPADPAWSALNIYFQSFYLDAAGPSGVSSTDAVHTLVR